MKIFSTVNSLT